MFSMLMYLIVIVQSIHAGLPADNDCQKIRLQYPRKYYQKPFTVLKDKHLCIVFEGWYATGVICHSYDASNPTHFRTEYSHSHPTSSNLTVLINEFFVEMSTKWKCSVHTTSSLSTDVIFIIHFKNVKRATVKVNQVEMNYSTASLSDIEDGTSIYYYEDGETVYLSCRSSTKDSGYYLRLAYYSDRGEMLIKTGEIYEYTESSSNAKFRSLMIKSHNYFYLDCIYHSTLEIDDYIYRTVFVHQNDKKLSEIKVFVNDLKLVPYTETSNKNGMVSEKTYKFIFQYIPEQPLTVSCWTERDELTVLGDSVAVVSNNYSNIVFKLDGFYSKRNISCNIDGTNRKVNAVIEFVPELVRYRAGLRIIGLNPKNTLYQYSNSSIQWIIVYEFEENETLSLTCVSWSRNSIKWTFEGTEYEPTSEIVPQLSYTKPRSAQQSFILLAKHDNKTIKCLQKFTYEDKEGRQQRASSSVEVQLKIKPISPAISNTFWLIFGAIGMCITIALSIICVIWRRTVKQTALVENTYDYVETDNIPIPAFPSQWENERREDAATRNDYVMLDNCAYSRNIALPVNQNRRTSVTDHENTYSEIIYTAKCNNIHNTRSNSYDNLRRSALTPNNETNSGYDNFNNIISNIVSKQNKLSLDHRNETALYENIDKVAHTYAKVNHTKSTRSDLHVDSNAGPSSSISNNTNQSFYENI